VSGYGRSAWRPARSRPAGGWRAPWRPRRVLAPRPEMEAYTRPIRAILDRSGAVVLNSGGSGFVQLAPDGMTVWEVRQAHVATTTGPTDGSQVMLYRSGVFPHRQLAESNQGGGDSFDFDAQLRPGDTLVAVWAFGTPGDTATLNVSGVMHALAG
jgi:hypothetical protein